MSETVGADRMFFLFFLNASIVVVVVPDVAVVYYTKSHEKQNFEFRVTAAATRRSTSLE